MNIIDNNRLEVDNKFDNLFSCKDFIKEGENLPKKVNKYLEKGKFVDNQWKDDNLKLMINLLLLFFRYRNQKIEFFLKMIMIV